MHTIKLPKNHWTLVTTSTAKSSLAPNFIHLVQSAYAKTPQGSFVNTLKDVLNSQWQAIDWDGDTEPDSVVFFRLPRQDENWKGYKIQGIGHDTRRTSIDEVLAKVVTNLKKPGWWIEASDAMEHILHRRGAPVVTEIDTLVKLFPKTNLRTLSTDLTEGKYRRKAGNQMITETSFGYPLIK